MTEIETQVIDVDLNDVGVKTSEALVKKKTLIINYGGSRSGKTYSNIQLLYLIAEYKPGTQIVMVSATYPKLKKTLLKDFIAISDWNQKLYNRQDHKYSLLNGSVIQFMSAENVDEFIGLKTDYAFLDEINTYRHGLKIFNHLEIRNEISMLVAFNPAAKFWITKYWDLEGTEVIHSTYKDNKDNLPKKIIDSLEAKSETDINFYKVYTLGLWGSLEGLVFSEGINWSVTKEWPKEYKWKLYGIDFGFSNDPTTVNELRFYNGQIYVKTLIYETGLYMDQLITKMRALDVKGIIIADKSNPQSIGELNRAKFNCYPSKGGRDSVLYGITKMKDVHFNIHNTSIETISEFRAYSYKLDKEGNPLNDVNKDAHQDHSIDGIRYAFEYKYGGSSGGLSVGGKI